LKVSGSKLGNGRRVGSRHGKKLGNAIYLSKIPLLAELYAGAVPFEGKWLRVICKVRYDPDYKKQGGFDAKLTQAALGRWDIHKLYTSFSENEM